ncbi:hypothetical protein OCK74_09730 [Chitinophagaceae bacterium LB-8]|uniref:Porin n=1 Tax=Paraflavisolibacter caeni TaxID=2982496 RepID=A0A9X2XUC5_9BACT|nr:hypothetical protein [Paraflavisolibacter caeni]MCU7549394.1 hypothetical protein [Paraflavisolibacter caeni]
MKTCKRVSAHLFFTIGLTLSICSLFAQDDAKYDVYDTTTLSTEKYPYEINTEKSLPAETAGEYTPGKGFTIYQNKLISLNLSFYGLIRYTNQLPATQSFTDHLGRERAIDTRHDIQWHRTFIWASGYFFTQRLRYTISVWGLGSTGQTLLFGNMQYQFNKAFRLGAGIGPNLGVRSLQGPWPYFVGTDRQMAEEALRPGFTGGIWLNGQILPKFHYWLMLGNNLSQLGINNTQMTRHLTPSASVWWMPTTGEFGPRGGYGDFEYHTKPATRFGASINHAREDRFNEVSNPNPAETQIRLSDGVLFFETGALGDDITIQRTNYDIMSFDAGVKYKGLHVQTEFIRRKLSNFLSDKPVPLSKIVDNSFYVTACYSLIKRKLDVYGVYGKLIDEFDRKPWEVTGGMSFFPSGTRSLRINLHVIRIEKSPAGSTFGYYIGGQSGTTISLSTDLLL